MSDQSEEMPLSSEITRRAVVVSFDHLHLGFVGCYGNDWIETPHLDRLATQAVVFDQHFSENTDPGAANHAWWTGTLQFPLDDQEQRSCRTWFDDLHARGVRTQLIVESDGRDDTTIAPPFGEILIARGTDGFDVAEGDTPFAKTVKETGRWFQNSRLGPQPAVLWVKSRGVPVPWVPPRAFAELYLDEFGLAGRGDDHSEPGDPPAENEPDHDDTGETEARSGVDESLDWRYAAAMYAAYATLVDRWLGKLLQLVEESPEWKDALLIVTAGAGQALGEHGRLADERAPLRAESLHAPLWIRVPQSDQRGTRRQAIVQPTDLAPTLREWFSVAAEQPPAATGEVTRHGQSLLPLVRNEAESLREVAWMGSGRTEWGLRTTDFFYAEPGDQDLENESPAAVLFEKPHDRWDQFDVASQFRGVVDDMHSALRSLHTSPKR